jgi:hypothetical protein
MTSPPPALVTRLLEADAWEVRDGELRIGTRDEDGFWPAHEGDLFEGLHAALSAGDSVEDDDRPICENCQKPIDGSPVITADEVYLHEECARVIWPALTVVAPPAASGPPAAPPDEPKHQTDEHGDCIPRCLACLRVRYPSAPPVVAPSTPPQDAETE